MSNSEQPGPETTALVPASSAERRVRRAKEQLAQHVADFEFRARILARQTAWLAGAVLVGVASAVITAKLLRAATRARSRHAPGYARTPAVSGVSGALLLAAAAMLHRRLQNRHPLSGSARNTLRIQHPTERSTAS